MNSWFYGLLGVTVRGWTLEQFGRIGWTGGKIERGGSGGLVVQKILKVMDSLPIHEANHAIVKGNQNIWNFFVAIKHYGKLRGGK